MTIPLRILIIEDSASDADLIERMLTGGGYEVKSERVQTAKQMQAALAQGSWDLITCDEAMPGFNVGAALSVLLSSGLDIPFIVVSGSIGEDMGVDMMIAGANDYVLKNNLRRLIPAVHREMADAANRQAGAQSMHALLESQGRYKIIVDSTSDAITRFDRTGHHLFGNNVALSAAACTAEQYIGKTHVELGYPEHLCRLLSDKLSSVFDTGQSEILELSGSSTQPKAIIELRLFPELDNDGKVSSVVGIARDISKKKSSEAQIWQQANFDALTNLPNRLLFHHNLDERIKQTKRSNMPFALLLIDLDEFKTINDNLGHAMGDQILIEFGRRLRLCLREADTPARLGGDEFVVLLTELTAPDSIERVAECILGAAAAPFCVENEKVFISASIGIAHCPADGVAAKDLLKFSDQALFEAKHAGRNCYRYFSRDLDEKSEARMHMSNEMHVALANHEFKIFYQPIIDLQTGSINKAEALIRWQHPIHGLLSPVEFIAIAEGNGLIVDIGNWIFKECTLQQQLWRKQFNETFQISVNLSPAQFRHVGILGKTWLDHLKTLPADNCLAIEITESLLLDASADVLDTLLAFRKTGIKIVIDDFGTGYSSLQYLKKFGVDFLKIDQSFVFDLDTNFKDRALCEAIISLAHKLGIKTIAEGVEMATQRDLLANAGCDYAQGYLYSVPLPAQELEKLLWARH